MAIGFFVPEYLQCTPYAKAALAVGHHPHLPSKMNEFDKSPLLDIHDGGMEVEYVRKTDDSVANAASVRSDNPIPPSCDIFYFEVEILSKGVRGYFLPA